MRYLVTLILFLMVAVSALSQSAACYQTVRVSCRDSIVDYLTLKEKKNLFKLHIKLQQLQAEVAMLKSCKETDSTYVNELSGHINNLTIAIHQYKTAYAAQGNALAAAEAQIKTLRREIRQRKIKGILGGVLGGLTGLGTGIAVTFLALRL